MKTSSISRWDRCGISLRIAVLCILRWGSSYVALEFLSKRVRSRPKQKKRFCAARVAEEREETYLFIAL